MVLKHDTLTELKSHFKLNIYEVKIWTALLSRGISSASELADISGVPRSRCYDILESLEKKGFIMMKIGKPIEYIAIKPEVIIERVRDKIENHAEKTITYMNTILDSEDFQELDLLYKSGVQHVDITQISRSIVGSTSINRHIKEMLLRAKSHAHVVTTQDHSARMAKLVKNTMAQTKKNGCEVTFFAPYEKNVLKKIDGATFKDHSASSQFVSIDGSEVLFLITPDSVSSEYEVGVWVESPFFVSALTGLFKESVK